MTNLLTPQSRSAHEGGAVRFKTARTSQGEVSIWYQMYVVYVTDPTESLVPYLGLCYISFKTEPTLLSFMFISYL
jgi:hypothetical protein